MLPLATHPAIGIDDSSTHLLSLVTDRAESGSGSGSSSGVLLLSAKGDPGQEVASSTPTVPAENNMPALETPAPRANPISSSSLPSLHTDRSSAFPQSASSSLFHSPMSTNRFPVHENVIKAGQKVIGQGARVGEVVFGRTRGYLATKKKLKKIRQHARTHSEKSKELASRLHGESVIDEAVHIVLNQELEQLRRRRDFLLSLCDRVEEEWSDGSALEYLDKILAGEQATIEPPPGRVPLHPFVYDEAMSVNISPLESTELWSKTTCAEYTFAKVFLESEFNASTLQNMVWTRNLFDAGKCPPRLYRRSKQDVSQQLPWHSGNPIQYPDLLAPSEKLRPSETIDVVLRPADTRYILVLVVKRRSQPAAKSVVLDRMKQTMKASIYDQYGITRVFDVNSWLEVPDKDIWGNKLKDNVDECPDYVCCALAVA